jgi:TolB-like protein/class 3 adenylate cyclase
MAMEGYKRKLTTILSADVAGYSRLMGDDEAATLKTLTTYKGIMADLIKQHRGRVIDSPGDNLLAEFTSVVDGVQCAVAVQKELQARNAQLPEERRMEFRIGVNLGDVIEEEDRIYGDGVNIAARLEALAEPGGICISKTAFDHIETKLPLGYEYLGEQTVKNVAKPVGAYRVLMEPRVTVAEEIEKEKALPLWRRKAIFAGGVAVIVAAIAVAIWIFYLRPPPIERASVERMALPLPEEPSIAVLPFTNMSGDPEQEYFSDGITEELITGLAKIPQLFVIARNSTFTYKGKPVKVQKVAEDLGVRYVLEGGVRKADDKIRITAQLIDAINGRHLWAERYDGALGDVFALQDKITRKIVAALAVKLTAGEQEKIARRGTDNVEAYEAYSRGYAHRRLGGPEHFKKFIIYMKKAVELDPDYSDAHAALSYGYWSVAVKGWAKEWGYPDARSLAKKHLQLAMRNPTARVHRAAAWDYIWKHEHEKAVAEAELALTLEPSGADSHEYMGRALVFAGRSKEAIEFLKRAMRLDPSYPPATVWWLGLAQFCAGQYGEAVTSIERARNLNPTLAVWPQAAAYGHLGRKQEAADRIAEYLKARKWKKIPVLKRFSNWYPFKDPKDRNHFDEGLLKAGVPEE